MVDEVLPHGFSAATTELKVIVLRTVFVRMTADLNGRARGMPQLGDQLVQRGATRGVIVVVFESNSMEPCERISFNFSGAGRRMPGTEPPERDPPVQALPE